MREGLAHFCIEIPAVNVKAVPRTVLPRLIGQCFAAGGSAIVELPLDRDTFVVSGEGPEDVVADLLDLAIGVDL